MSILFLIILSLIALIAVHVFIFTGVLYWLAKFFKVDNVNFKTTLKIFLIYLAITIPVSILVNIIYYYSHINIKSLSFISALIIALFFIFLAILVGYYLFYLLFKKFYFVNQKTFIKIFILFTLFGLAYSYFVSDPVTNYMHSNLFEPIIIQGEGMNPTFISGDFLIVKKLNNDYLRRDVIVFKAKDDYYVERIIGLPNEYIQNSILNSDEYFVLGDNRENSYDSIDFGLIKKEDVLGKIIWGFRLKEFKIIGNI